MPDYQLHPHIGHYEQNWYDVTIFWNIIVKDKGVSLDKWLDKYIGKQVLKAG